MKKYKDKTLKSGLFDVSPDQRVSGTLLLNESDSSLHLWHDSTFRVNLQEGRTITGILDNQSKISLIECLHLEERFFGFGIEQAQHYKYFPHYVIIGHRYFSHAEKTISKISIVVNDAATLFHDRESFGTFHPNPEEFSRIIASKKSRNTTSIGNKPIIAYFTGKYEIFSAHTLIGKISAYNSPSINVVGGPKDARIKNKIFLAIDFKTPVSIKELDSQIRMIMRFLETIVGRPQYLLEVNIIEKNEKIPQKSRVYFNTYPRRSTLDVSNNSNYRDILLNAASEPDEFSNVLGNWLKREKTWCDARVRFSASWKQHRSYDADRIIRAANMFDLLPEGDIPIDKPLSSEL